MANSRTHLRCYCREASADGRNLHVMYVDYGNTEWLERDKTTKLNDGFFELRPQGVLAKLSGIKITLFTHWIILGCYCGKRVCLMDASIQRLVFKGWLFQTWVNLNQLGKHGWPSG